MYLLVFYVPASHLELVKNALFAKGAGKLGDYDSCSWECVGNGQFRPLTGSNPFSGKLNKLTIEPEYRVEMIVAENHRIKELIAELKRVHPYEVPAYAYWEINHFDT